MFIIASSYADVKGYFEILSFWIMEQIISLQFYIYRLSAVSANSIPPMSLNTNMVARKAVNYGAYSMIAPMIRSLQRIGNSLNAQPLLYRVLSFYTTSDVGGAGRGCVPLSSAYQDGSGESRSRNRVLHPCNLCARNAGDETGKRQQNGRLYQIRPG